MFGGRSVNEGINSREEIEKPESANHGGAIRRGRDGTRQRPTQPLDRVHALASEGGTRRRRRGGRCQAGPARRGQGEVSAAERTP